MENTRINVKILGKFHREGSLLPPFLPPLKGAFLPPPITRASLEKGKGTILFLSMLLLWDETMGCSLPTGRGKAEEAEEGGEATKPSRRALRRDERKADKLWKAHGWL
mgnify:CR=1 FL=1